MAKLGEQMNWKIAWIAALTLISTGADAQLRPGKYLHEGCTAIEAALAGRPPSNDKLLPFAGECLGSIQTVIDLNPFVQSKFRFCMPSNANRNQAVTIVARYLERHTADLEKPFTVLAIVALQSAWPCRD